MSIFPLSFFHISFLCLFPLPTVQEYIHNWLKYWTGIHLEIIQDKVFHEATYLMKKANWKKKTSGIRSECQNTSLLSNKRIRRELRVQGAVTDKICSYPPARIVVFYIVIYSGPDETLNWLAAYLSGWGREQSAEPRVLPPLCHHGRADGRLWQAHGKAEGRGPGLGGGWVHQASRLLGFPPLEITVFYQLQCAII